MKLGLRPNCPHQEVCAAVLSLIRTQLATIRRFAQQFLNPLSGQDKNRPNGPHVRPYASPGYSIHCRRLLDLVYKFLGCWISSPRQLLQPIPSFPPLSYSFSSSRFALIGSCLNIHTNGPDRAGHYINALSYFTPTAGYRVEICAQQIRSDSRKYCFNPLKKNSSVLSLFSLMD